MVGNARGRGARATHSPSSRKLLAVVTGVTGANSTKTTPTPTPTTRRRRRGGDSLLRSGAATTTTTTRANTSSLSCPLCSPQNSAEDSDFLYYPDDEDIPVALCKYVYGYPRDFHERYEVLEELGKGSFGVVHRVVDRETGEFYAAKTLPKSRPTWTGGMDGGMREATTSTYLLKIQSEVNFLARLSDVEEVVRLEKACEDDTHVHLVMDLCEGGSLRQRMESAGKGGAEAYRARFTEERVKQVVRGMINMLVRCHERGIIYRDIKPENFLFTREGGYDLKVSDFGLAMTYIVGEDVNLTKRAGTPVYMAPELVLRRYDERADLWSAGVLMYQLLSNKLPLWGGKVPFTVSLDDIFFDILIRDIDFGALGSEEAADLCKGLLCRDPEHRIDAVQASQHPWLKV